MNESSTWCTVSNTSRLSRRPLGTESDDLHLIRRSTSSNAFVVRRRLSHRRVGRPMRRGSVTARTARPRTSRRMSCARGRGRRGPGELWRTFDAALAELTRWAATGTDLVEVAVARDALAAVVGELAAAVAREDRKRLLPRPPLGVARADSITGSWRRSPMARVR